MSSAQNVSISLSSSLFQYNLTSTFPHFFKLFLSKSPVLSLLPNPGGYLTVDSNWYSLFLSPRFFLPPQLPQHHALLVFPFVSLAAASSFHRVLSWFLFFLCNFLKANLSVPMGLNTWIIYLVTPLVQPQPLLWAPVSYPTAFLSHKHLKVPKVELWSPLFPLRSSFGHCMVLPFPQLFRNTRIILVLSLHL